VTAPFRCAAASLAAGEPICGSASTVRAFLLVEAPGPWGVDAVSGSRLPDEVKAWLGGVARRDRVRPLMIRGHGRQRTGGTRVFVASVGGSRPWVETTVLADVRSLVDLDLSGVFGGRSAGLTPYDEPMFFVCTHGRHDACCAERGRPVCKAMHAVAPDHTWEVSHIGGDRFAPNLLVLPYGLYYGRLAPEDVGEFVDLHRAGRLSLPHLRGRCAYPFPLQAAEVYVRERTGHDAVEAPLLAAHERNGEETVAELVVAGERWRVRVRTTRSTPHQLTCSAVSDSAALEHELLDLTRLPT
jgi:hypothetical protein